MQTNQPKKILPTDGQVSYPRAGTSEIDPEKQAKNESEKSSFLEKHAFLLLGLIALIFISLIH